ncbi:MAG: PsbP-related protein [Bacteroidota bacterium]|nr:PsbP-related protein [Bacteroidota bacterium]
MKKYILISSILLIAIVFFSCGKKMEPVKVEKFKDYKDQMYGFKIQYPEKWLQLGQTGNAQFYQSQGVKDKFIYPGQPGELGTEVLVQIKNLEGKTFDDFANELRDDIKQSGRIDSETNETIKDKPAIRMNFTIPITTKMNLEGYKYIFQVDTLIYTLSFSGFGEWFGAHTGVFAAMLNSFQLPAPVVKTVEGWTASTNLGKYETPFFVINYPDNLNFMSVDKGKFDFAAELRADRQDCSIRWDVFDAQDLPVEKVFDQNKVRYKMKSSGEIVVDGQKTMFLNYTSMKDVESRGYFVVKNNKVIRITINWFNPQKQNYLTPFENIVTTMKLK